MSATDTTTHTTTPPLTGAPMAAQPQAQSTDDQESAQAQRARLDRMAHLPKAPAHAPAGALVIESLDMDAQGIAHREDGKVVFVEGALPFEVVSANVNRKKNNWEQATLTAVYAESSLSLIHI